MKSVTNTLIGTLAFLSLTSVITVGGTTGAAAQCRVRRQSRKPRHFEMGASPAEPAKGCTGRSPFRGSGQAGAVYNEAEDARWL